MSSLTANKIHFQRQEKGRKKSNEKRFDWNGRKSSVLNEA